MTASDHAATAGGRPEAGLVLVAGATGYLGRHVVSALAARGLRVRVLVRDEAKLAASGPALAPAVRSHVDEIAIGDLTRPESLRGVCDGVAAVFSSVSLMAGRDAPSWHAVDYLGNLNLMREAKAAGVRRFVYVSVFNAHRLMDVPMVAAHEAFARELTDAPLESTVIRPTAYFSDLGAYLEMARSGRVFLLGTGNERLNPIHGADLAQVCADALTAAPGAAPAAIEVGGPQVLTQRQVAELAIDAVTGGADDQVGSPGAGSGPQVSGAGSGPQTTAAGGGSRRTPTTSRRGRSRRRTVRVRRVPVGLARALLAVVRLVAPRRADLWRFFVESAALDHVAPATGSRTVGEHFRLAAADEARAGRPGA